MNSSPKIRVLVVDDEPSILLEVAGALKRHYDVLTATSAEEAERMLAHERLDLLLTDLRLPGKDGLSLLESAKAAVPDLPVVLLSGHGTIEEAVKAIRLGAADFLEKPFGPERLQVTVERALELRALQRENARLRERVGVADEMIGKSKAIEQIRAEIAKVAKTEAKVLITGESGTGKELVARAIHRLSARARGPFEKMNCAALPKDLVESELFGYEKGAFTGAVQLKRGRLEASDGGTLFLDEVGDMSLETQAKFLRAIETGEIERLGSTKTIAVDARVVSATNKDLPAEIQASRFREDLFYRLNVVPIHLPPLRARRDDVPLLVEHFIAGLGAEHGRARRTVTTEAMERLTRYGWPGNIRELKNLIERLLIMTDGETIGPADVEEALPADSDEGPPSEIKAARDRAEKDTILATLRQCDWNVSEAAAGRRDGRGDPPSRPCARHDV
ncbi:MAG TPA: sigma-54 dependent transcriptional regulator [Acidobacteriota bacterium]|nr:sigma-54 dependent transcriptional regulator [Acidobacteriota bacterium]